MEVTHAPAEADAQPRGGAAAAPLRVGAAHDPYEHEADRIARRIVAAVGPPPPVAPDAGGLVRRACGCGASCDCAGGQPAPPPVHAALGSPARPLDAGERAFFEPRLGADLGSVRVHGGTAAQEATASVGAIAFTVGEDVVLPERTYSPGTTAGRLLLGHELAHVLQQRAGGGPATVRRQVPPATAPAPAPAAAPPTPQQVAATATAALQAIRTRLATDLAAARALPVTTFPEVRTAVATLDQAELRARLDAAHAAFEAARTALPADSPLVGPLRLEYAETVTALRQAMDTMHGIAEQGDRSLLREEEPVYGTNLVAVLAVSPVAPAQVGTRTAFTQEEVTASGLAEADLRAVLATVVPFVNIASASAVTAAEGAVTGALHRIEASGAAITRSPADPALVTLANGAIARLRQGHDMMRTAATWTAEARAALDRWRGSTTQSAPDPAGDAFKRFVGTDNAGWARAFSERLATLARELGGQGRLYAHLNPPTSTFWCDAGTLGKALTDEFVLCRVTTVNDTVKLIVHECAHSSVTVPASPTVAGQPANWNPAAPPAAGAPTTNPNDRAYPGERLLLDLTPAEAVSNAETYAQFVLAATGRGAALAAIPADTYQGMSGEGLETVRVGFARAESRARRLENHVRTFIGPAGTVYPAWVHAEVDGAIGRTLSDAEIQTVLDDVTGIHHHFGTTRTFAAPSAPCPAGVVARTGPFTVAPTGTVATAGTASPSTTVEVCDSFYGLGLEERTTLGYVLAGLTTTGRAVNTADLVGYARYAATIWTREIGDLRGTPVVTGPAGAATTP